MLDGWDACLHGCDACPEAMLHCCVHPFLTQGFSTSQYQVVPRELALPASRLWHYTVPDCTTPHETTPHETTPITALELQRIKLYQ